MSDSKREDAREAIYGQIIENLKSTATSAPKAPDTVEAMSRAWGNIEYGPQGGTWNADIAYEYDYRYQADITQRNGDHDPAKPPTGFGAD